MTAQAHRNGRPLALLPCPRPVRGLVFLEVDMSKTLTERQQALRAARQAAGLARLEVWVPQDMIGRLVAVLRAGEGRDELMARAIGRIVRERERRRKNTPAR